MLNFEGISSKRNEFTITEDCTDGQESATIPDLSDLMHPIHHDILLIHEFNGIRKHYCVECKTRKECGPNTSTDLKRQLKTFIQKAYKSADHLQARYGDNYGFMFISDVPFEVWDNHINHTFITEALKGMPNPDQDKISRLAPKIRIMVFSDWFAALFKEDP